MDEVLEQLARYIGRAWAKKWVDDQTDASRQPNKRTRPVDSPRISDKGKIQDSDGTTRV